MGFCAPFWLLFWKGRRWLLFFFHLYFFTRSIFFFFHSSMQSSTLSLTIVYKKNASEFSIHQCRVFVDGSEGGQKSGLMNFCPNFVSSKSHGGMKTTSSLWDHRHSGLGLRCYPSILLSGFFKENDYHPIPASEKKEQHKVWFRSTNVHQ